MANNCTHSWSPSGLWDGINPTTKQGIGGILYVCEHCKEKVYSIEKAKELGGTIKENTDVFGRPVDVSSLKYLKVISNEVPVGYVCVYKDQTHVSNYEIQRVIDKSPEVRSIDEIKKLLEAEQVTIKENSVTYELVVEPEADESFNSMLLSFLKSTYNNLVGPNLIVGLVHDLEYSGRLWRSLNRLKMILNKFDEKDLRTLSKAIFLAEDFNNELDAYMTQCLKFPVATNWLKSKAFKTMWKKIKDDRDAVYAQLISIQKRLGKEIVTKALSDYSSEITRYSF